MKKVYLGLMLMTSIGYTAIGQISDGGLPLSMQSQIKDQYIPATSYALPDWESARTKAEQDEAAGFSKPYLIGLVSNTNISFPSSGTFVTLDNGQRIWRAQVKIADAPAIGLYYDKFQLPAGVKYYLSNGNGQQVLGSYTEKNNAEDGLFANEAVQGDVVNLELNIDPKVNLNDIKLHIDRALVYFRSYEYLGKYITAGSEMAKPTGDPDDFQLEGSSSTCGINAICPLGVNYPIQRKSSLQVIIITATSGGVCSATMINSTGNTGGTCKQYVLTATHCDANNSTQNSNFSQFLFRFNFEKEQCTGGAAATVNTMTGANFVARANYIETQNPQINGDFLLLELKTAINPNWDIYLSGWNRAASVPAVVAYPKRYIGFHHPAGDIKKVSVSNDINPNGEAGGSMGPGTHWQIFPIDSGGIEGGSSGSGLFDGEGRLIGVASVAGEPKAGCGENGKGGAALFYRYVAYSKMSVDWDYAFDGPDNFRKLKPWLDPTNSGVVTLDPVKSNCTSAPTGISNTAGTLFDNSISLYPNPTTNGIVTAQVNFANASDLTVEVYNVTGVRQTTYTISKAFKGTYTFDLGNYANGIYLLKFSDGTSVSTKKVMLNR
jgi:hypothetical protein